VQRRRSAGGCIHIPPAQSDGDGLERRGGEAPLELLAPQAVALPEPPAGRARAGGAPRAVPGTAAGVGRRAPLVGRWGLGSTQVRGRSSAFWSLGGALPLKAQALARGAAAADPVGIALVLIVEAHQAPLGRSTLVAAEAALPAKRSWELRSPEPARAEQELYQVRALEPRQELTTRPAPPPAASPHHAFSSIPASASASRDFDESPPSQGHTRDTVRPYTDGNDSARTGSTRSAAPGTFDPYTRQCASTDASSQRSGA